MGLWLSCGMMVREGAVADGESQVKIAEKTEDMKNKCSLLISDSCVIKHCKHPDCLKNHVMHRDMPPM